MNLSTKIRIGIVDDHNLFRKGLIKLINLNDPECKYAILFEADNGLDLFDKIDKNGEPDILIMDINMPDMDGFKSAEIMKTKYPNVLILVVSMLETEEAIVRMLKLGVRGYLSKDIEVDDIQKALQAISGGGYYYCDSALGIMASNFSKNKNDKTSEVLPFSDLSANEKKFMVLACTELTYHQIADKMNLSPKTIDGYRESLFHKFNVKSRVSLAMFAVRHGLVKLN